MTLSQPSIREKADPVRITVTAKLAAAAPIAETIKFTIGAPSDGMAAVRDVDYQATLGGNIDVAEGATEATTALILTPIDNEIEDGNRSISINASASGNSASADFKIADDETSSTSILLSSSLLEVSEDAGKTTGTITATLDGKAMDDETTVIISIDSASEAQRDVDYFMVFDPVIKIAAGEISGSLDFDITPRTDDDDGEGSETITLIGSAIGTSLADGTAKITLKDAEPMVATPPLAFAEGAAIDDIEVTVNTALDAVTLPEASGGEGDISYALEGDDLPAGVSFDAFHADGFGYADGRRHSRGHLHGDCWRRRRRRICLVELHHHGQPAVGD